MNSTALYSISDTAQPASVSPYEPLPQYKAWRYDNRVTLDILEEIAYLEESIEVLKDFRLKFCDSPRDVEYVGVRLKELLPVVEQRRRLLRQHQGDPLAPSWPTNAGKVGRLASDLKQVWPLPRFCRELLLVDLQGHGDQLRARCPAPTHHDKTPSFVVFVSSDRWRCFGACNTSGDIFDLIRVIYGHESFTAQVKMLARATGMDAPR